MGKAVMEYSSGGSCICSHWLVAFELSVYVSIYNCVASDAEAENIQLGIHFLSIVTVSGLVERMRYEPNFRGSSFKYKSVASLSASDTGKRGRLP